MSALSAISVSNISKSYGSVRAVNNVSFEVASGELFGLIGPDGAGKTSIFRMLTTLLLPDSGTAMVGGDDVVANYPSIRSKVGYMPGRFSLYQDLTVEENLTFFATIFGTSVSENYDFIRDIYDQIAPFAKRRAGKLSGGMKQKLALCCALIHKPEVLFLDEPTTGVDVVSRREFWGMLRKLKREGITILVSTPYMDEAVLCDRIALIQDGSILSIDTPGEVVAKFPRPLFAVRSDNMYRLLQKLQIDPEVESCYTFGDYVHLTLTGNGDDPDRVKSFRARFSDSGLEIKRIQPSIEDSFIRLVNERTKKVAG